MNKNFVCGIIFMLLVGVFVGGCGSKYNDDILTVRKGSMNMLPDVPIGKAFDQFFSNGKWTSFTSKKKEKIVEFNGKCEFIGEPVDMKIQFSLDGDTFTLEYLGLDGVGMEDEIATEMLRKILSDYKP